MLPAPLHHNVNPILKDDVILTQNNENINMEDDDVFILGKVEF